MGAQEPPPPVQTACSLVDRWALPVETGPIVSYRAVIDSLSCIPHRITRHTRLHTYSFTTPRTLFYSFCFYVCFYSTSRISVRDWNAWRGGAHRASWEEKNHSRKTKERDRKRTRIKPQKGDIKNKDVDLEKKCKLRFSCLFKDLLSPLIGYLTYAWAAVLNQFLRAKLATRFQINKYFYLPKNKKHPGKRG